MGKEDRWIYDKVDIGLIDGAGINANRMSDDDFGALCDNIGVSGLSSVLCCYRREDGRFTVISGHHRLEACKRLGYARIGILYCEERDMSKDEILALQLSHNSIHGESDRNLLKEIFSQIRSVDFKRFAHIDMDEVGTVDRSDMRIFDLKTNYVISVILYSQSVEDFNGLFCDIEEARRKSDVVLMAGGETNEDNFLQMMALIRKRYQVKSTSVTFAKMLELARKSLVEEGLSGLSREKNMDG